MNPKFSPQNDSIILYRHAKSGHSHRAELMLAVLDLPYETVDVDLAGGAHEAPAFLRLSTLGQVPVIDDNGDTICDSNAILVYLARRYSTDHAWLPAEPLVEAEVQRWLSIAAGEIAQGPCAARLVMVFGAPLDQGAAIEQSHKLLRVIDTTLSARRFLAGQDITIADIAGYTYIAHAPEGGVDPAPYVAMRAWLDRVEAVPGFVGMAHSPLPGNV